MYLSSHTAGLTHPFNAGDDRFVLIVRYLGDRFRGRTVRDLKAKAHEFRREALRNGVLDQYDWL